MKVTASAPGKAFLLGEYAVLCGAPALLAALDRRAISTVETAADWSICATFGGERLAGGFTMAADGSLRWRADVPPPNRDKLRLAGAVLHTLLAGWRPDHRPAAAITLDTSAFYDERNKLGLGSSAAATVALAGALAAWIDAAPPSLGPLVALHRSFQGGRGSGADIAAALHGGVVRVRSNPGAAAPSAEPVTLPAGLAMAWFWTGRPADTRDYLNTLSRWQSREPTVAAALMERLAAVARRPWSDAATLVEAAARYAEGLLELDRASRLGIFAGAHARLRDLAADLPVVYKPCGAGGGDLGVALATDAAALASFARQSRAAGIRSLPVRVDGAGLLTGVGGGDGER